MFCFGGDLEKYLQGKYELKWASYAPQKISDCVMHMDQLCEKNEKYYIIIPWLEKSDKRVNILKKYGYEPYKDFFFIKHNKIQIITKLGMHYKDEYGNEVISDSDGIELENGVAPLVRTGGSRHTGLAAPPHRNIQ